MRSALAAAAQRRATRSRSTSLSAVPPAETSNSYLPELAAIAASILYRSPLPSKEGRPIYILNAAAFPDAFEVDYDSLLSYVLARLPGEDELISGTEYEVVFFAGGQPDGATTEKKQGPGMGWYLQAYHVLSRATRKKLQRLYIVHPRTWVRVLVGVFGTIVSPKFRRKIIHVSTLSQLALQMPVERLLIPPSTYLQDRRLETEIDVPYASGRRAFGARHALPRSLETGETRLPRVLREATSFALQPSNITTEGLFRIPPHSVLAGVLKEAYDRGQHFIVWKERNATLVQPGMEQALLDEVRPEDAYSIHLAASLIKQWYRDLRDPIFPESSYTALREKYGNPDDFVSPEDLVDLILPASPTSPLTPTSREILTRHLLPLLSAVAAHEPKNKMNAENLSILFSMCLLCGSNQLEDAKMSSVVKKILQAAIGMWPQLRDGLGIDERAFERDLRAPWEEKQYEDPLVEEGGFEGRISGDDALEGRDGRDGHRILMMDGNDGDEDADGELPTRQRERAPALPPRKPRSRASSAAKQLAGLVTDLSPLKRRPAPAMSDSTPSSTGDDSASSRSTSTTTPTAPASMESALAGLDGPPLYSTVFDGDGNSLHVADPPSSVSYVPADGFGPARRGQSWRIGDEKKQYIPPASVQPPTGPHPVLNVPKRKAVSSSSSSSDQPRNDELLLQKTTTMAAEPPAVISTPASTTTTARSASEGSTLARMAAQKATTALAHRIFVPPANGGSDVVVQSPESVHSSEGEGGFRKPSWPASATRQQPNLHTLAKPVLPPRQSQTVPIISEPATNRSGLAVPPSMPKPRTPSPGLLKRMSTMEANNNNRNNEAIKQHSNSSPATLEVRTPNKLNLRKASVDDLRKLYEERLNTADSLQRLDAMRRGSSG